MSNTHSRASDVRVTESINLQSVIAANSASIAALPIISTRGSPEPKFFTNPSDFLFEYGNPDPSISNTIQSGLNFFTEGTGLWATRVVGSNSVHAGIILATDAAGALSLEPTPVTNLSVDPSTLLTAGKEAVALFFPKRGPGSHGNTLQVEIVANPSSTSAIASVTASEDPVMLGTLKPSTAFTYYVAPLMADGELAATQVVFTSPASNFRGAVKLQWASVTNAIGYYVYNKEGRIALVGIGNSSTVTYTDVGAIANTQVKPVTALSPTFQDRPFTVRVFDASISATTPVEELVCSLRPALDTNGVQLELEAKINNFSSYISVVSGVPSLVALPNITSVAKTAMSGGDSGLAPLSSDIVKAISVFASRQKYTINLFINAGLSDPAVQRTMDTIARQRGDAIALLDVPSDQQAWNTAIDYRNLQLCMRSDYSALFAPDQLQTDPFLGSNVYAPLSGWVAALCARTDRVATPAHSMAGLNRGKIPVIQSRYQYDDAEASAMFRAQVNYTRVEGAGTYLWEQQTLGGKIPWLSIRRIVNVIKTSTYQYLLYALQEMNTDSVRRELLNSLGVYLDGAVRAEALSDYKLTCDNSNNPKALSNAGVLVFRLRLIPQVPIHEIDLEIVVSQAGVSFNENVTSNTTTEFSSGPAPSSYGTSNTTTEFSSGLAPSSYGTSNTTIEYSSGTGSSSYGSSHTTNEFSSTRPF